MNHTTTTTRAATTTAAGSIAAATVAGDSGGITQATLAMLAPHPDNPRGAEVGEVGELAVSIGSHGVLEPLVVIRRDAFMAARPDTPIANDSAEYVIVAGHRRYAAAQLAGVDGVPIVVRDDLAGDGRDVEVMLAENLHRTDLTAMQEARAFAQLRDLGRSQRAIAAAVGCGQSHVSKRLALLELPPGGQDAIDDGRIGPAAAEELLRLRDHPDVLHALVAELVDDLPEASEDPDEQDLDGPVSAEDVRFDVENALRQIEADQRAGETRKTLAEQGIPVWDEDKVRKTFGRDYWDHRLYDHDDKKLAAATKAGTLVATIGGTGGPAYYTTAAPKRRNPVSDSQARHAAEDKHRTTAMKARAAACTRIVKTVPAKDTLIAALARTVICRHIDAGALDLAYKWLHANGSIEPVHDTGTGRANYAFEKAVLASDDPKFRAHVAYAMAIAAQENQTRQAWRTWDASDAAYLHLLVEKAGYQPTDWEHARLDTITTEPGGDDAELDEDIDPGLVDDGEVG